MLTVTMLVAGIGAMLFIISGVRWASMQKLLKEGEYYLVWLFVDSEAQKWNSLSWIVRPVAGVLFAGVMAVCNIWMDRKEKN